MFTGLKILRILLLSLTMSKFSDKYYVELLIFGQFTRTKSFVRDATKTKTISDGQQPASYGHLETQVGMFMTRS